MPPKDGADNATNSDNCSVPPKEGVNNDNSVISIVIPDEGDNLSMGQSECSSQDSQTCVLSGLSEGQRIESDTQPDSQLSQMEVLSSAKRKHGDFEEPAPPRQQRIARPKEKPGKRAKQSQRSSSSHSSPSHSQERSLTRSRSFRYQNNV